MYPQAVHYLVDIQQLFTYEYILHGSYRPYPLSHKPISWRTNINSNKLNFIKKLRRKDEVYEAQVMGMIYR